MLHNFSPLTISRTICSYGNSLISASLPMTAFLTLFLPPPLQKKKLQMSILSFFLSLFFICLLMLHPSRRQELCKCPPSHAVPFPLLHPSLSFLFRQRAAHLTCPVKFYSTCKALFWIELDTAFGFPII